VIAGLAIGIAVGVLVGAVSTVLVGVLVLRFQKRDTVGEDTPIYTEVTDEEVTAYRGVVSERVSQFADKLAGDDVVLREQLRRFERRA